MNKQDLANLEVYTKPEVAAHYASLEYLTPCERLLFDAHLKPGMAILDVGVGGGRITPYLSGIASYYAGVDYSEEMVRACRKKFPQLDFFVGDAADLSRFPDASFDAIVMAFNALDYVLPDDKRHRCLRECHRLLRPGGVLIFSSHNPRACVARVAWSRERVREFAQRFIAERSNLFPLAYFLLTVMKATHSFLRAVFYTALSIMRRTTQSAFWRGEEPILDAAHGGLMTHFWTPTRVTAELAQFDFELLAKQGDDYPRKSRIWLTGWFYYVFAKKIAEQEKLQFVIQKEVPVDDNLRAQWNVLAQKMERPEVFYTYEWALAAGRALRDSLTPLLILAYRKGVLAGVAALASDRAQQKTAFLASTTADYCDFVSTPQDRAELVDGALAELQKLKMPALVLANLPAGSSTVNALADAAHRHGYFVFSRPSHHCAQVVLSSAKQKEETKQSVLRKQMLRRHMKAMAKIAPVNLDHRKSWERIAEILPSFTKAHVARFLATGRISFLVLPERQAFLAELAKLLAGPGWIDVSCLMVGEQQAAWNYGFQFAGSWFWYQPTFDGRFQKHYPGLCLLAKIVEEACDSPEINRVDLGLGAEEYKEWLATGSQQTLYVTAATSRATCLKEFARYHATETIRKIPWADRWVRIGLRRYTSSKKRLRNRGALAFTAWLWRRGARLLFAQDEVLCFEWRQGEVPAAKAAQLNSFSLRPIDLDMLATAALQYGNDAGTMTYLLRVAGDLHTNKRQGYALVTAEDVPLSFCWVADFEGFYVSELDHRLKAWSPDAVILFDCWTPRAVRGHGHYGRLISLIASQLSGKGKLPWIFCANTNISSVRGIDKSGFVRRFSLARNRLLSMGGAVHTQSLERAKPPADDPPPADQFKAGKV